MSRKEVAIYAIIMCLSIITPLLFSSNMSWLFTRGDSNVFFLIGKGWMNGLIPYVDLGDSKGPLLWFIYGVGYLIDNTSYLGIYIIEALFDFCTILCFYKTVELFVRNRYLSLLSSAIAVVMLYYYGYHMETVSETFNMPFLMLTMYFAIRCIYFKETCSESLYYRGAFLTGISTAATILIKYNVTVLIGIMLVFILISVAENKKRESVNWWKLFGCYFFGLLLLIIPFIIYFSAKGILGNFFHDYFIEIPATIENINQEHIYLNSLNFIYGNYTLMVFLCLLGFTSVYIFFKDKAVLPKLFPIVFFVLSLSILMRNGIFPHYYEPLFVMLVFPLVYIMQYCEKSKIGSCCMMVVFVSVFLGNYGLYYMKGRTLLKSDKDIDQYMKTFNEIETILSTKENTTFMFVDGFWGTFGMKSNALPGCKFFMEQAGATANMLECRNKAIESRSSDFVILYGNRQESIHKLVKNGYRKVYEGLMDNQTVSLYQK